MIDDTSGVESFGIALVLESMPWDNAKEWIIRVVIPGADGPHAVCLETTCIRETKEEVEVLLDCIMDRLKNIHFKRSNDSRLQHDVNPSSVAPIS